MDDKIRLAQVYELQRIALTNVHYYGCCVSRWKSINRFLQVVTAVAASGTVASVIRNVPNGFPWVSFVASVLAAVPAAIVVVYNLSDKIAYLERMHAAYKMLYHSAENLAKQTIGSDRLTPEQDAVASMLDVQLAALGPQDEIDPNRKTMREAQERAEQQLPESYYYPQSA